MISNTLKIFSGIILIILCNLAYAQDIEQLSCLIVPSKEIKLANEVAGVVRKINVDRGDKIRKDDILLTLEHGLELAEIQLAKAKEEFLERKLDRNQDLIDKGLIADYEADEIITERNIARLELAYAEKKLSQKLIYSPVDAVVIDKLVSIAEYAGIEPLMILAVLDPLHADIVLASEHYGYVTKGMKVIIEPDSHTTQEYDGVVKIVDQIIDAASGTFRVQVEIQNPDLKLPAGLNCTVKFINQ
jgi:membrane fusion protein, multidrug efflux system